jgi:DegV family protein with EDD domain
VILGDYVIFTDSTADLSRKQISDFNIKVLPLKYEINNKNYVNNLGKEDLPSLEFYNLLRQGSMATTSQVNQSEFTDMFEKDLSEGKDILYIAFSSMLSGTYASSLIAKKNLKNKYPGRKILLIDTLSASAGEGLAVYLACEKKALGFSIEDNANFIEKKKLDICHWFVVDSLDHLKRGGRVSSAAAFLGGILGIRPILHVNNDGKLEPVKKARGKKLALNKIFEEFKKSIHPKEEQTIFISHADSIEDAKYLAEKIKESFSVKQIFINSIGPVIGSHAGPGTIALFFLGKER